MSCQLGNGANNNDIVQRPDRSKPANPNEKTESASRIKGDKKSREKSKYNSLLKLYRKWI